MTSSSLWLWRRSSSQPNTHVIDAARYSLPPLSTTGETGCIRQTPWSENMADRSWRCRGRFYGRQGRPLSQQKGPRRALSALLAVVEPGDLFGRQLDLEGLEAVVEFAQGAGADQRDGREGLGQHEGQGDMDRVVPDLPGQFDGAVTAGEVLVIVPAAHQFLIVGLVATGAVGEEAAALAGPGEIGDLGIGQPLFPRGGRRGDAAIPDRHQHFAEGEIVAERHGLGLATALGIFNRGVEALPGPIAAAERPANATGLDLSIHGIDEFADRDVGVVAVHEVD